MFVFPTTNKQQPNKQNTDVSGKLYRTSAYYVAKQLAVLPFAVINSLLFAYTLYGMAGLRNQPRAVGMNGIMSVLIYLIAAQVCGVCVCVLGVGGLCLFVCLFGGRDSLC